MLSRTTQDRAGHHKRRADGDPGGAEFELAGLADTSELGEQSKGKCGAEVGQRWWRRIVTTHGLAFVTHHLELGEGRTFALASCGLRFDLERESHAVVAAFDSER